MPRKKLEQGHREELHSQQEQDSPERQPPTRYSCLGGNGATGSFPECKDVWLPSVTNPAQDEGRKI